MMNAIKIFFDIRRHTEEKRKEFYFNCVLGIFTLICLTIFKNTSLGQESINWWFDKYIPWQVKDEISSEIVFLDFDNTSMLELNRPSITPRDKVADLVKIAYEGGAKIIILDFEFSDADYSPEKFIASDEFALDGETRDKVLYNLLQTISYDTSTDTKILLLGSTYADMSKKKNIFSSLIDEKKIYEVTPNFSQNSEGDRNIRFWLPYLKIKNSTTNEKSLLWSLPIMTLALTLGNVNELHLLEKVILSDLDNSATEYSLSIVRQGVKEYFIVNKEIYIDNGVIRDTQSNKYNRIQYTLIPNVFNGNIPPNQIGHWRKNGIDNERLDCRNKIVIIGRADDDCNDIYSTPVRNMPGMYIHGNAIETVLSDTRPHLTSTFKNLVLEITLIVIVS